MTTGAPVILHRLGTPSPGQGAGLLSGFLVMEKAARRDPLLSAGGAKAEVEARTGGGAEVEVEVDLRTELGGGALRAAGPTV